MIHFRKMHSEHVWKGYSSALGENITQRLTQNLPGFGRQQVAEHTLPQLAQHGPVTSMMLWKLLWQQPLGLSVSSWVNAGRQTNSGVVIGTSGMFWDSPEVPSIKQLLEALLNHENKLVTMARDLFEQSWSAVWFLVLQVAIHTSMEEPSFCYKSSSGPSVLMCISRKSLCFMWLLFFLLFFHR